MKRGYIYAGIATLLLVGLYFMRGCKDKKIDAQIAAPILGSDDKAKTIFDQKRHTVTRVVRGADGVETVSRTFLNSHGPVAVLEKKNGNTVLVQRTWGTEVGPFLGCALGSDIRARAAVGVNLFYVQRWEMGGGLLLNTDIHDTRLFAHVSYNVYDNAYISLGVDNRRTAQVMAGLKF